MSDVGRDEAHEVLVHAYSEPISEEGDAVTDIAAFHDATTSFLALMDQHSGDDGELPDDLDADTKRQLHTAQTLLKRATSGIEAAAADRLTELETETDQ